MVHRYGVAPRPPGGCQCHLPLKGAGIILGFVGRLMLPCRPVALYPRGKLLLTAVFQDFSGFEIDLHGAAFPARAARPWGCVLGMKKQKTSSEVFF